jgi:N-acetylglucosaminyldiphosphoundecaprenol N-acetyl-beta-D-mannosaminyltransferase
MSSKYFCGIRLEPGRKNQFFKKVLKYVQDSTYHYQISVNVAKLVYAQNNARLRKCINNADIINSDGMPIKIITQILYKQPTSRIGGLDYMLGLAEIAPELNYYFLGAEKNIVKKVVSIFRKKYGLNIVGWRDGYFQRKDLDSIIKNINQKETDILFIALGTPQKEYFLYDNRNKLKCKFAIGVGGAFDIIAGKNQRAPEWMQNIGMEWFYRTIQEPGRMWKRYSITNIIFIGLVLKEIFLKLLLEKK